MGIVVKHGAGLSLGMAAQTGKAIGEAQRAEREDAQTRQMLLAGLSIGAQGARQKLDILANEREREKDRAFTLDRDRLNDTSRAAERAEEFKFRAAENDEDRAFRGGLADREFQIREKNNESDNKRADEYNASRVQAEADRSNYYKRKSEIEDQTYQQEIEERNRLADTQNKLMQGLDSEYSDPDTGELMPDGNYFAAKAEIMQKGHLSAETLRNLPSGAGGRGSYQRREVGDSDAAAIALTMPKKAVELATMTEGGRAGIPDPKTGVPEGAMPGTPTKESQAMLAAVARLPYSDAFNPLKNPNYFRDLTKTVEAYREAGASPEMLAPLEQRLGEERMRRAKTIIPKVYAEVENAVGAMAEAGQGRGVATRSWWDTTRAKETQKRLNAYGITPQEYREWATAQASARSLFRLESNGGGRPQGRQGREGQGSEFQVPAR